MKQKRGLRVLLVQLDQTRSPIVLVEDYVFFLQNLEVLVDLAVGAVDFAHEAHDVEAARFPEYLQNLASA